MLWCKLLYMEVVVCLLAPLWGVASFQQIVRSDFPFPSLPFFFPLARPRPTILPSSSLLSLSLPLLKSSAP